MPTMLTARAVRLFEDDKSRLARRTSGLFAYLLIVQWLLTIVLAVWISPLTWSGTTSTIHPHVWTAVLLGGLIITLPVYAAFRNPSARPTCYLVAVAQMLIGSVLIHVMGGRIEAHFHVFGSLAFLAFYRDFRVLLIGSAVVAADHVIRGLLWPESVYGVARGAEWRWIEHAAWVVFEDVFLLTAIRHSLLEMRASAQRQAELEYARESIEKTVEERTAELVRKTEDLRKSDTRRAELNRLATLRAEVGMVVNQDAQLTDLLQGACESILKYVDAAFVRVWTLNEAEEMLELRSSVGMYTHINGGHARVPVGQFKIGRIAKSRQPHISNTVTSDPEVGDRAWAAREGMVSFAGHPLVVSGRVVGVLALFARHPLSPDILDTVKSTADTIALGIVRKQAERSLQENVTRIAAVVETALDSIISLNADAIITDANPAAEQLFGVSKSELIGQELFGQWVHPILEATSRLSSHLEKGEGSVFNRWAEAKAIRASGEFLVEFALVRTSACEPHSFTVFLRDVTEVKRAAQRRNARLSVAQIVNTSSSFTDAAPKILAMLCDNFRWSIGMVWMSETSDDRLRCLASFHLPHRRKLAERLQSRTLKAGMGVPGTVFTRGKPFFTTETERWDCRTETDREECRFRSIFAFPIVNGRKVTGVLEFYGEEPAEADPHMEELASTLGTQLGQIVERESTEHSLRESEQRFRQLFEANPHPMWVTEPETKAFLAVNDAAVRHYGWSRDEFLKMSLSEVVDTDSVGTAHQSHRLASGSKRLIEVATHPVEFGGHPAFLSLLSDVTDRKMLEDQLKQAQKLESIGQLAAGIAHEINTPIQYIGDNTTFLGDAFRDLCAAIPSGDGTTSPPPNCDDLDYLREEIPRAIRQTLEGVGHVARIVKAMKEFSHPGSDAKSSVDLNHALENVITVARNEWKYVAEVKTELDPQLPSIAGLPGELNQVFLNLLVNAAHAIRDVVGSDGTKGTITLSTRSDGGYVEVRVRDTGCGIPESIRAKVFDPFFTTKPVGEGTGQGLTIAHNVVVRHHGGSIALESEVGRGTCFILRLPVVESAQEGN